MTEIIISIVLSLLKWLFDRKAGRKLTTEEFVKHVNTHQNRRQNVVDQATEFEENMADAFESLQEEQSSNDKPDTERES